MRARPGTGVVLGSLWGLGLWLVATAAVLEANHFASLWQVWHQGAVVFFGILWPHIGR